MKLFDLKIVIENLRGSYKKFADTLEEYPILGVTFPVHYGYIDGYIGEDTHDLDVFVGSGEIHGIIGAQNAPNRARKKENLSRLSSTLKNIGSNLFLKDGELVIDLKKPFATLRAAALARRRLPRPDANSQCVDAYEQIRTQFLDSNSDSPLTAK